MATLPVARRQPLRCGSMAWASLGLSHMRKGKREARVLCEPLPAASPPGGERVHGAGNDQIEAYSTPARKSYHASQRRGLSIGLREYGRRQENFDISPFLSRNPDSYYCRAGK